MLGVELKVTQHVHDTFHFTLDFATFLLICQSLSIRPGGYQTPCAGRALIGEVL
jgi:hypothetical protein